MGRSAALLLVPLALLACRRGSTPGQGEPLPQVAPKLEPLKLPPLGLEAFPQVVEKLARAHYDPARLGLQELAFEVDVSVPPVKTRMQGTGTWKRTSPVEVKVRSVERKGRTEVAPSDPGIGKQVWTAIQLQTENLLEGIGAGFLNKRFDEWRKQKGESKLEGGKLLLSFSEPSGETIITVGPGYVVEKVENRSPRKITRWMEYKQRLVLGYNLISEARLRVSIEPGADMPPGGQKVLKASDGLTFQLEYADAGGYHLPVRLRKTSSRGEEVLLNLRYTRVR